ncbi:MAG: hypothetical protein PSY12_00300, partial [bacterium]|nr:hypothetical protein [bacterium]
MTARYLIARYMVGGVSLIALSAPVFAQSAQDRRVNVTPYIGVDQVVMGPLKGGGDVLTYSNVTAGITAEVQNRRVEATVDLEYNHSFSWSDKAPDQDVLSGVAHAQVNVARGLSIQTGGLATRVRTDGLSGSSTLNDSYTSQVYAGYIGPAYATKVGDVDISASYRLGYARVEDSLDSSLSGAANGGSFADSWTNSVTGSVGVAPGTVLPIGLVA